MIKRCHMEKLKLLSLNIGNPSLERAIKQCTWLVSRPEDIFVLTETKNSRGCHYIENFFSNYGNDLLTIDSAQKYYVNFPCSTTGDLGVMIISKYPFQREQHIFDSTNRYFSRQVEVFVDTFSIMGLYVPSRDRSDDKIERKFNFLSDIKHNLSESNRKKSIILGDFNILEKNHIPHYSTFFDWEYKFYDFLTENEYVDAFKKCNPLKQDYSWVGRTGDGYRYDYCFVSNDISHYIQDCKFIHETREKKLTDHSAIILNILLNNDNL